MKNVAYGKRTQKIIFVLAIFVLSYNNLFAKFVTLSLEEKTHISDLIIIGKVVAIKEDPWITRMWHTLGPTRSTPSNAEIEVENIIKGSLEKNKIFVGCYKGIWIEDQIGFEVGEKVLLFLKKIKDNYYVSVNLMAGKKSISDKNTVYIFGDKDMVFNDSKVINVDDYIGKIKEYMILGVEDEKK